MADIRPFRAIRYSDSVSIDDAVTPPYDVINADQQRAFYEQSPENFVRIDLGVQQESDTHENNRYTRARQTLMDWLAEGILELDKEPCIYYHEQTFQNESGEEMKRKGFFATLRLADYEEGIVLPHERTLKGPKIDRLNLMKETECHLSPVFFLYDDPEGEVDKALASTQKPVADLKTKDGVRHVLWKVSSPEAIEKVQNFLKDEAVLIADGHHRYETALAYRQHRRNYAVEENSNAPYEFALGFFVNFRDPGLAVFGTHRVVHHLEGFDFDAILTRISERSEFQIEILESDSVEDFRDAVTQAGEKHPSFILLSPGKEACLIRYVGTSDSDLFDDDTPEDVRVLDVAILHEGIFDRMLGLSKSVQEAKTNLKYIKGFDEAYAMRKNDENQLIVLMNATKIEQVNAVCRSGGKMPQKSTFFYPKVLSGLLVNPA